MKSYNLLTKLILGLLLCACAQSNNLSLEKIISVEIKENLDNFIEFPVRGSELNDSLILLQTSRTEIKTINTNTGDLNGLIEIDTTLAIEVFAFLKGKLSELSFVETEFAKGNYTFVIGDFTLEKNEIYVPVVYRFNIEATYEGARAHLLSFFNVVFHFDVNGNLKGYEYIIDPPNTSITVNTYGKGNALSPSLGFFKSGDEIYVRNAHIPVNDTCKFVYVLSESSQGYSNSQLISVTTNPSKQMNKEFNNSHLSFARWNNDLYCSDGKDVFNLKTKKLFAEIISDKYYSLKSFQIVSKDEILYSQKCDTSMVLKLNYLSQGTCKTILNYTDVQNCYILGDKVYSIENRGQKYYITVYEKKY